MSSTIEHGMMRIGDALIDLHAIGTLEMKANAVAGALAATCLVCVPIRLFADQPASGPFNPAGTFLLFVVGVAAVVWFALSWKLVVGANGRTFQVRGSKFRLEQLRAAIVDAKRR
jgi:hypothetical protein